MIESQVFAVEEKTMPNTVLSIVSSILLKFSLRLCLILTGNTGSQIFTNMKEEFLVEKWEITVCAKKVFIDKILTKALLIVLVRRYSNSFA